MLKLLMSILETNQQSKVKTSLKAGVQVVFKNA